MVDVLRLGSTRGGGRHSNDALRDLRWRQKYVGSARYVLELANGRVLSLEQRSRGEGLGTGGTVWPAAHVLCRYLERRTWSRGKGDMRGLRVLELGAGTACAALACAALGADRVVATDLPDVLSLAERNVVANGLSHRVETRSLEWGIGEPPGVFDLIVASECVLPQLYPLEPLADTLSTAVLAKPSAVALVAYEHRTYPAYDPRARFAELLAERGVLLRVVPNQDLDPDYSADDIQIWECARGASCRRKKGLVCRAWGEAAQEGVVSRFALADAPFEILEPRGALGAVLWPSSVAAARYFVERSADGDPPPRTVLELGAGCGLLAVVLAKLGHRVFATDLPAVCRDALEPNLDRALPATLRHRVDVHPHVWGRPETLPDATTFDIVVCSDCAYASTHLQPLLSSLSTVFGRQTRHPPDLVIVNEHRTALDALLTGIRKQPHLHHLRLVNLHPPAAYWTIDCAPPHRQPPPIALFRSTNTVAL